VFDFLGGLLGGLSNLGAELQQILAFLVHLIVEVFQFIANVIVNVFKFFINIIGKSISFFHHILNFFFKDIWPRALSIMRHIHDFLEAKLGPIIKFLKKYRDLIDRNYRLYIKPILNFLQKIRQVLAVMRLLHIKFARELDAKILQLEGLLTKNFLQLRGILTSMLNALNAVVDFPLLFRKPVLVLSIRRVFLSLVRVLTGMPPGWFFPSPRKHAALGLKAPTAAKPFRDPSVNPPASSYLPGDDGLAGFEGFTPGETPDDGAVDALASLDYFADELYSDLDCTDYFTCLAEAIALAQERSYVG
jgi:hypothetical protein